MSEWVSSLHLLLINFYEYISADVDLVVAKVPLSTLLFVPILVGILSKRAYVGFMGVAAVLIVAGMS